MKRLLLLLKTILLVSFLTGCSEDNIFVDPFFSLSKDEEPPLLNYSNLVDIEYRTFNINEIEKYDFSPYKIGISSFDNRDGDLTSKIEIRKHEIGPFNGSNFYVVSYTSYDQAGNSDTIWVPFRVYEEVIIDESNFDQFFELEENFLGGVSYPDGNALAYFTLYLKPLSDLDLSQILSSNLKVNYEMNFYWVKTISERTYRGSQDISSDRDNRSVELEIEIPIESFSLSELSYKKFPAYSSSSIVFENTAYWYDDSRFPEVLLTSPGVSFDEITRFIQRDISGEVEVIIFLTD